MNDYYIHVLLLSLLLPLLVIAFLIPSALACVAQCSHGGLSLPFPLPPTLRIRSAALMAPELALPSARDRDYLAPGPGRSPPLARPRFTSAPKSRATMAQLKKLDPILGGGGVPASQQTFSSPGNPAQRV